MRFFTGWQMWEKLVFILAGAIVATLLLASLKLAHTLLRLRRYAAAVAKRDARDPAPNRRMTRTPAPLDSQRPDAVPFGIRALESGVEVEGVWISRAATPELEHTPHSSPPSLCLPPPQLDRVHDPEAAYRPTRPTAQLPSKPTAPITLAQRRFSFGDESDPDLCENPTPPPLAPLVSLSRDYRLPAPATYPGLPRHARDTIAGQTLDPLDAVRRASTASFVDGSSSGDHSDADSVSPPAPRLLTVIPRPRVRHSSASAIDLDLLNSHRRSLAAETGQLTPRLRRLALDDSRPHSVCASAEQLDYFALPSAPPTRKQILLSTHEIETASTGLALSDQPRRSSMPDAVPFAQFCRTTPPSPRFDTFRASSMDARRSTIFIDSDSKDDAVVTVSPLPSPLSPRISPQPTSPYSTDPPVRGSFELRPSHVLRGHGTGFEILRPGSLQPPSPRFEYSRDSRAPSSPGDRQKACPPLSLYNSANTASLPRSPSADGRRRLHKRRQSSMDSTASSTSSRRSRFSMLFPEG